MTLPTFFIIGAAKAGTTSLHYYLEQHPEIQMSSEKEPNYYSGPPGRFPYPMGRVESQAEYESLFDPNYAVRGEASVSYANHPRRPGVPERIKDAVPQARFIYLVRDPVARAISHYQHQVAWMGEKRPPEEVLGNFEDPCDICLCPGFYAHQLERYHKIFQPERTMVIDQADLLGDRTRVLREIFTYLGVDPGFTTPAFEEQLLHSQSRRVYSPRYTKLVEKVGSRGPLALVPRDTRRRARASLERLLWPKLEKANVEPALRERLADLYTKDVSRLREMTGKAFASWSV